MGNNRCSAGCKEEFNCSNWLLKHDKPYLFVTSQWLDVCRCSGVFYLVWRVVTALTMTVIWVRYLQFFLLALTQLTFTFLTLDAIIQCAMSAYGYWRYTMHNKQWNQAFVGMPRYLQMQWVITNIASVMGLEVTLLNYTLNYNPANGPDSVFSILTHGFNSLYIIVNLFITAVPVRVYHVWHSWVAGILYLIATVIYTLVTGQPIYPFLDWARNPALASVVGIPAVTLLLLLLWLVYYGLYRLRLVIYHALLGTRRDTQATHPEHELTQQNVGQQLA